MSAQPSAPTVEQLRLRAAQLRMAIPADEAFEAYIEAWVQQQRGARAQAQEQLRAIETAIKGTA
jgi:hypothetical protein